ncbi:MAG TPA: ergothioneine biosynthesis protein EgtB [Stellaceae bacterium]|nr:ergothioneine biosynthesis protein EgtB [Stellaceae bacterium]
MLARFSAVRDESEALAANLTPEDQAIQSMPDVSPTKWHLAHTTWFFESFILSRLDPDYRLFDPAFAYLFNSYYEAVGPRHPRPERGLLSRPTVDIVGAYRDHVSAAVARFAERAGEHAWQDAAPLLELGLHHEQQHQELMLMDIKHVFSINPLLPAYQAAQPQLAVPAAPLDWIEIAGGLVEIGHRGAEFAFDNEIPRHKVWLEPFRLATRPVSCGEFLEFIEAGGYRRPEFWLSDGWATAKAQGWESPLYWLGGDDGWKLFTLDGVRRLNPAEPVCHISFFEADAFAKWAGKRLPTEAEWEVAAENLPISGNFANRRQLHPRSEDAAAGANGRPALRQMFGDVWEWTASPYIAYPRFRAAAGAVGEYNGKFMCNQMVLRGGAAVTPAGHVRASYRNFFPPAARWAFSGLRLAEDG